MFGWLRRRRRNKILREPFKEEWIHILEHSVPHYNRLTKDEQQRLRDLIQVFIAEKRFEGISGIEMTDQIRVCIAASACLMILALSLEMYRDVESILVYPSAVIRPRPLFGESFQDGEVAYTDQVLSGEAHEKGPVILAWDSVACGGLPPDDGLNVVIHEFAHKIDMRSGTTDGVPPLKSKAEYRAWTDVCDREYNHLVRRYRRGFQSFFDEQAAEHPSEFFAVASEFFFERPVDLLRRKPELYEVLQRFYRQNPAVRVTDPDNG